MLSAWLRELSDLMLPAVVTCQLCGSRRRPGKNRGLCCICEKELVYWEERYHSCTLCGRYIGIGSAGMCHCCALHSPPFAKAVAVGPYRGILKESLCSLKFRGDRNLAIPLGSLLAQKVRSLLPVEDIDIIVPVPLYEERKLARGFNQADLIAREVGKRLRKPVFQSLLVKRSDTPAQTHLSQRERKTNLEGAFMVKECNSLKGTGVLLVDDIYTTGSTAAQCTKTLSKFGAKKVYVATVATGIFCSTE